MTPTVVGERRQSILGKAFRGELVPTEAELARAEGRSFESAEELLARVRAWATGVTSPGRTRGRRRPRSASSGMSTGS